MKKEPKNVLLTWHSLVHGVIVTARCLHLLLKEQGIRIAEVHYLQNTDLTDKDIAEISFLSSEKDDARINRKVDIQNEMIAIRADLLELKIGPAIHQKRLHLKSPSDYDSIWKSLRDYIQDLTSNTNEEVQFHINLSPGTPQMHVVWLMLNSGGHLPNGTRLWSIQIDRTTGHSYLEEVKFKPKAYLSEVFERKLKSGLVLNDETTIKEEGHRAKAMEKVKTFAMVPNAPILILGERGVGKSTMIQEMFKPTKTGFVEITCGTFSDDLFRSELFGHRKGSFSSATSDKKGLIETVANGGILFLDEIQDLSKANQRMLLQILQHRIYYPIGDEKPKEANFRIVAATNLSLSQLLASGRLDLDFFDRISRFIVEIPPLRDTPEDLPAIWAGTWRQLTSFEPDFPPILFPRIAPYLQNLSLPGNIRDLERIASLIVVGKLKKQSDNDAITQAMEEYAKFEGMKSDSTSDANEKLFKEGKTKDEIEKVFYFRLHSWAIKTYGSVAKAAKALGVSENTIRRMEKGE